MPEEAVCALREVSFTYSGSDTPAIDGVSLTIRRGSWFALLGNNGSGKSTLARIIKALLTPTQGSCSVCGCDTAEDEGALEASRRVAMVFQNPENQIVGATVEQDVAFGPENLGLPTAEIGERVAWALEETGLKGLETSPTYALSGGQKQRLAVAGALAIMPQCLILDEATTMLDPQGRAHLLEVIRSLHRRGMTVVHITHRLEEIAYCTEACVLDGGRIAWQGPTLDLLSKPELEWGLELPPVVRLWRELQRQGMLDASVHPASVEILEALCPSR
ncbi:MAG: ATP-binding cassette domain-containing protein [Synergistales bacterium]|nr:ATP-binding cassette domain-containing protein [Synergistales bacterium]